MSAAIERLRALLAAATPGPWRADSDGRVLAVASADDDFLVATCWTSRYDLDAELIASAVNALPALLEIAKAARPHRVCDHPIARKGPVCGVWGSDVCGVCSGCRLAGALARLEGE